MRRVRLRRFASLADNKQGTVGSFKPHGGALSDQLMAIEKAFTSRTDMSPAQFSALKKQREVMLARCDEALTVGSAVPEVSLLDAHGDEVCVSERMREHESCKGAVLVFFRGSW